MKFLLHNSMAPRSCDGASALDARHSVEDDMTRRDPHTRFCVRRERWSGCDGVTATTLIWKVLLGTH
jgi:hypothetical protein